MKSIKMINLSQSRWWLDIAHKYLLLVEYIDKVFLESNSSVLEIR